jgi:hypothetical protein
LRRGLIWGLGALMLFSAGAIAGLGLASQTAPRKLRGAVEASLSEALGTPVTVESARLLVFPGVKVEATAVAAWPGEKTSAFTADRLEATLDPAALASGRLRFSSISLDGAHLELARGADGSWTPPLFTPGFESPLVVLGRVFAAKLPAPTLEVRSGSLTIVDQGAPRDASGARRFELDAVTLRLLASGLLEPGRLILTGMLRSTKAESARFELDAAAARSGLPRLSLAATGFPLHRLVPYLRERAPGLSLAGHLSGLLELAPAEGGATDLSLDALVAGLRAGGGGGGGGTLALPDLDVERLGVTGALRIAADSLALTGGRLRADDLELSLAGNVARPVDDTAPLAFEATLPMLSLERLRQLGGWLPGSARRGFEDALRGFTAGRLEALSLSGKAPIDAWRAALEPGGPWLPPGARLEGRGQDLTFQPPGDQAVTGISGGLRLEGPDALTVSGLEGILGGRALPVLELRLTGLRHLLAAPSSVVAAVPALAGRKALQELLLGGEEAEPGPGWTSLAVVATWIFHPAFFRPLRAVKARFEPTPDGVMGQLEHASWGGVPIRGEGAFSATTPEHVRLSLEAGAAEESPPLVAPSDAWARGSFVFDAPARPGLHVTSLRGGFDLTGTRLSLFDAFASLGITGRLTGDARLDLGHEGEIPAELRVSLVDAKAADVLASLSDDPAAGSGSVDLSAHLLGPLRPGAPLLSTLEGDARITAIDGELAIELPMLLAIAKASTTFNPFGSARGIRFERIDAELRVEGGRVATKQSITIESPDLRLAVSGSVDLRQRPHRLEAVVGCFFFKPLDQVLGALPFVSRILLGPDRSLFGTFFALSGSWESPKAGLIPTKTLALGPATFLMEDVPSFVKRGIEAIQSVLPSLWGNAPAVASPAEAADPTGDGS